MGIVFTIVWVAGVTLFAAYEFQAVSDGDNPKTFVVLRDVNSQKEFGGLSAKEIKEFGRLTLKKSQSSQAEPTDADEAKFLLAANPKPALRYSQLALWIALPVLCAWAVFIGIRWATREPPNETSDSPVQLDKFISTALTQILDGISAANKKVTGDKPIDEAPKPFLLPHGGTKESGTGIEFDLAVTIKSGTSRNGLAKAKILSVVEAQFGASASGSNEQFSRIKFIVFVNQWRG